MKNYVSREHHAETGDARHGGPMGAIAARPRGLVRSFPRTQSLNVNIRPHTASVLGHAGRNFRAA